LITATRIRGGPDVGLGDTSSTSAQVVQIEPACPTHTVMTVALRPPAYFPPLRYLSLLTHVDQFILADTFRFRRDTFHSRSKLRNAQGAHWITIPVFGQPAGAPVYEVEIETGGRWREKHWRSFLYDYRTTMYFPSFKAGIQSFFGETWTNLANCTCRSIDLQTDLFGISTQLTRASALDGAPSTVSELLRSVEAETLMLPMDEPVPSVDDVQIRRFGFDHPRYRQNFQGFEPGMSAMDLVLNYGPEARRFISEAGRIAGKGAT